MASPCNALEPADRDDPEDQLSMSGPPAHAHSPESHLSPQSLGSPVFAPPLSASTWRSLENPNTSESYEGKSSTSAEQPKQTVQAIVGQGKEDSNKSDSDSFKQHTGEEKEFTDDAQSPPAIFPSSCEHQPMPAASSPAHEPSPSFVPERVLIDIQRPLPRAQPNPQDPATAHEFATSQPTRLLDPTPTIVRTASGRKPALKHPTPDSQVRVLQGAYTGNIEHLERTAERLSMTSSIDRAIKELHDEQKRSGSRRSSVVVVPEVGGITRQMSNASSIIDINAAARSGGYSPAGLTMSPQGSVRAPGGRMRSASKSSRFGSRPEPEMEGRPLDSLMSSTPSFIPTSPALERSMSIEEQDENSAAPREPAVDQFNHADRASYSEHPHSYKPRPVTATSTYTSNEQAMFEGFDGVHTEPAAPPSPPSPPPLPTKSLHAHFEFEDPPPVQALHAHFDFEEPPPEQPQITRPVSSNDLLADNAQRKASPVNRPSMARPQSYADPSTGQQMVYYPAPVPMMLNLPQKLSQNPSSMGRNKRRSQVMSNIPAAARQSAIWLPDVLETEPGVAEDEDIQSQEYLPQHQRATMGGRRHTQDLAHLPPQLRASAFFDLPAPAQTVEMKEQSAVATLDSILDASAHAPVNAFTDHAFAGHLGDEVYGKPKHERKSSTQMLDQSQKRRTSSFNLLKGRRASSQTLLLDGDKEKKRASIMSALKGTASKPRMTLDDEDDEDDPNRERVPGDHLDGDEAIRPGSVELGEGDEEAVEEDEEDEEEEEEEEEDEVFHGQPTTLLAELLMRKQQQKLRTRNPAQTYPNGMHSTLLQMDAVAQVEQRSRKQKKVNLAWETAEEGLDDPEASDDDVPLAILFSKKAQDLNRPIGLLERREIEDNEPLSKRRERITGRPAPSRAATMINLPHTPDEPEEEGETLAQRIKRLREKGGTPTDLGADHGLPRARPISGDFASEMMSTFGGDLTDNPDPKGKEKATPPPPEDETLGQRRKRLQAEREASGDVRPSLNKRHSMANILHAHPSAGDKLATQTKPATGLLGLHEQRRSSTLLNHDFTTRPSATRQHSSGFKNGLYNDLQGGIKSQPYGNMYGYNAAPQFAQPTLAFNGYGYGNQAMMSSGMLPAGYNPYAAMAYNGMPGAGGFMPNPMMHMQQLGEPLNQGQIDMVERWRQSVMQ